LGQLAFRLFGRGDRERADHLQRVPARERSGKETRSEALYGPRRIVYFTPCYCDVAFEVRRLFAGAAFSF
jgi:hypothetical protein